MPSQVRSFTGSLFNDIVAVTRQGNGRAEFNLGPGNDPHNVVADLGGVDVLRFAALAGADEILVEDLTGTGLDRIEFELKGRPGATTGDGQVDRMTLDGSSGGDRVTLTTKGTLVAIEGLAAFVQVSHPDPAKDQLILRGLEGNDTIDARSIAPVPPALAATVISFDDLTPFDPDTGELVEIADQYRDRGLIVRNGVIAESDLGVISPPNGLNDFFGPGLVLEFLDPLPTSVSLFVTAVLGDRVFLTATGPSGLVAEAVTEGFGGPGDETPPIPGQPITLSGGEIFRVTLDALFGRRGDIVIDDLTFTPGSAVPMLLLTLDGGTGDDILLGSAGRDMLLGGDGKDRVTGNRGDDEAFLGAGDDTFFWAPGDGSDVIDGGAGRDIVDFTGSGIDEAIVSILMNEAAEIEFFRNVAMGSVRLDGVETIRFAALGGTDNVSVGDLSGSDAERILIDLAGASGSRTGDGQQDSVSVEGTDGDDKLIVVFAGTSARIGGLQQSVVADHIEAQDLIIVLGGSGNDRIESRLAGEASVLLNGGSGDDVLIGGRGDDLLTDFSGSDRFVFSGSNGVDTVTGFRQGDLLVLSGYGQALDSFADLASSIAQVGADVRIDLGAAVAEAGVIVLENTLVADLAASDFVFSMR